MLAELLQRGRLRRRPRSASGMLAGKGSGRWSRASTSHYAGKAKTMPSATEGGKGEYDLTAAAERFIEKNRDGPFLVYLAHNTPHIPYAAQAGSDREECRRLRAGLRGGDREHSTTRSAGCWRNSTRCNWPSKTIVVFTSDNGGLHVPEGPHPRSRTTRRIARARGSCTKVACASR